MVNDIMTIQGKYSTKRDHTEEVWLADEIVRHEGSAESPNVLDDCDSRRHGIGTALRRVPSVERLRKHLPTRHAVEDEWREIKEELDHAAHGNRSTFLPGIATGAPGMLWSYSVHPLKWLLSDIHQRKVNKCEHNNHIAWQRLRHRERLHYRQDLTVENRRPTLVAKGHYHTKGDPLFDRPDLFGD